MPTRREALYSVRIVPLSFLVAIIVGTVLLALPDAATGPGSAPLLTAFFTATSAVCVTGLTTVDTQTYWSGFGQAVIMGLFQIGGLGVMTLAALLSLVVYRRLGLGTRLAAESETRTVDLSELRGLFIRLAGIVLAVEGIASAVLAARFWISYGLSPGSAIWQGVFHGISAFNNAGFSNQHNNLLRHVDDPWINFTVAAAVILGGIGFPVLLELRRGLRKPRRWSIHTRITVFGTLLLLPLGTVAVLALEWSNPRTLGPLGTATKVMASFFQSVTARTAGLNTLDIGQLETSTLAVLDGLMFVGGGSGGTAGGIKITTFFLLGYVIWAELRGEPDVRVHDRRMEIGAQRQALAIALIGIGCVALGTLALLIMTPHTLDRVLFEVISAFATVGLSTGITPGLGSDAQLVLIVLMFVGRVGPMTVGAALALRSRHRLYRLPKDRPIVG